MNYLLTLLGVSVLLPVCAGISLTVYLQGRGDRTMLAFSASCLCWSLSYGFLCAITVVESPELSVSIHRLMAFTNSVVAIMTLWLIYEIRPGPKWFHALFTTLLALSAVVAFTPLRITDTPITFVQATRITMGSPGPLFFPTVLLYAATVVYTLWRMVPEALNPKGVLRARGFRGVLVLWLCSNTASVVMMVGLASSRRGWGWEVPMWVAPGGVILGALFFIFDHVVGSGREIGRLLGFLQNILDSIDVGIIVVDDQGRALLWNRFLESRFGEGLSVGAGRRPRAVLGGLDLAGELASLDGERVGRRSLDLIVGGEPRTFELSMAPMTLRAGQPRGAVVALMDVSERASLEQVLQDMEKLAHVGRLSAGIAHEINNPLTMIASWVQFLLDDTEDPETRESLVRMLDMVDRITDILQELLSFTRPPHQPAVEVDVDAVVARTIQLVRHDGRFRELDLRGPVTLTGATLRGTPGRLQQVLINLLFNAADASPPGGRVRVEVEDAGDAWLIHVIDEGCGIPAEDLPHIFDMFFSSKAAGKGSGMGLALCRRMTEDMGGLIHVDGEQGTGTRFALRFPRTPGAQDEQAEGGP